MHLNEQFQAQFLLYNNSPLDDFCGLSPVQMHRLLYYPYREESPIRIKKNLSFEIIYQVGLFRVAEELLHIVFWEKELKLTATVALPPKIVKELYGKGYLSDYAIDKGITKLMKETDCTFIMVARLTLEIGGALKKRKNQLSLTKKSEDFLIASNRRAFFMHFLQTYTEKFRWASFDDFTELPIGQMGWAFTVFLLLKYGNVERETSFYSIKYQKAFPFLFNDIMEDPKVLDEHYFASCYTHRSFSDYLCWFSIVDLKSRYDRDFFTTKQQIIAKDLLQQIFELEE